MSESNSPRMSTSTRRRSSLSVESITEPEVLGSYLCGYELRTCTLYTLWLSIIITIICFSMVVTVSSFIHLYVVVQHTKNETLYTFLVNDEKLFALEVYRWINGGTDLDFPQIGRRVMEVILSCSCVNLIIPIAGLVGVYNGQPKLLIPYLILLIGAVLWLACFIILDLLLICWHFVSPIWWLLIIASAYALKCWYQVMVIYSYYHHYSTHGTYQMGTPPNLTTESPMLLPTQPVELPTHWQMSIDSTRTPPLLVVETSTAL